MIYVECKPDETLVRLLTGLPRREIIHELKGKGEVVNQIKKRSNAQGLVDEDPGSTQHRYLRTMRTVHDLPERGLRLLGDSSGNRIVILCPRLEEWIVQAAREEQLAISAYCLPEEPRRLHRIINDDLRKFERLVNDLRDSAMLTSLHSALQSLHTGG
jgi:hypothetical protein